MINSTMQAGLNGMQAAYQGMANSANDIARLNVRTNDAGADINAAVTGFAQPLVELRMNQTLFDASANVVGTSDAMVGSLLDVTV
ncbi:flagellar biosynthesis protein FlgE [Pseudohongiella sp.]|uniref:Flagellar basal-body/hook protein C-terminal domain-containing protein n=1 Tax=marine sediment metagenome TaxID=412755 RepID=A0A0F9YKG6_9ZZZZ|nr:flagellar biosynthesis protein FlgE [Pseudohongiella sp.]HDZ08178.1 flagellar biosynthesis protein FlgE [Pseudohongiella sp.]HEA63146.1 flagellar biosynthesis protein FlgE [Pseudohongiella sp.]